PRKAVEELVLWTEHDRGAQDRRGREGVAHRLLAGCLAAGISRTRTRIGANRRDMDEPRYPGLAGQAGQPGRCGMMHQIEALAAAFAQDADAIDDRVVAGDKSRQQPLVVDRDVDQADLPDIAL